MGPARVDPRAVPPAQRPVGISDGPRRRPRPRPPVRLEGAVDAGGRGARGDADGRGGRRAYRGRVRDVLVVDLTTDTIDGIMLVDSMVAAASCGASGRWASTRTSRPTFRTALARPASTSWSRDRVWRGRARSSSGASPRGRRPDRPGHRRLERHRRGHRAAHRPRAGLAARRSSPGARSASARSPRSSARATVVAADLTEEARPRACAARSRASTAGLHLLVNNAGAAWRARFGEGGWENVRRHMELNFDAACASPRRCCRCCGRAHRARSSTSSSTAGRVARGDSGAYSRRKFALAGWTDALHLEERATACTSGLVLPGFVATEGFPQRELVDSAPLAGWSPRPTRWPTRSRRRAPAARPSATCRARTGWPPRPARSPRGSCAGPARRRRGDDARHRRRPPAWTSIRAAPQATNKGDQWKSGARRPTSRNSLGRSSSSSSSA